MCSLKPSERNKFELLFGMSGGYVLDFTNSTFEDFFITMLDISKYEGAIADTFLSKAKRLRAFWRESDDDEVAKVNQELMKIWLNSKTEKSDHDMALYRECIDINYRLSGNQIVRNISALTSINSDLDIDTIIKDIKRNIDDNNPELTLDRLHNYLVQYGRQLCSKHSIRYTENDTLNSLFGSYNKWMNGNELLESKMSSKIIGSIVKLLEDFNYVRNQQSAAHPNPLLNKIESLFIVDTICSIIGFITKIEDVLVGSNIQSSDVEYTPPF